MAGIDASFDEAIDGFLGTIEGAKPVALGRAAEHVRGVSVELAPILDGNLRGSAGVEVHTDEALITYDAIYSRYQHYGLDFNHPQGGQALYLEQPMITEAPKVMQIIADTVKEAM